VTPQAPKTIVIGYGNPGRQDDGLGPAVITALTEMHLPNVTLDADYQLTVEDAAAVAEHDVVVFVDAAIDGPAPFSFRPIGPGEEATFSSHSVPPETVLRLAIDLFGSHAEGYVLGIRGYDFDEFDEALSGRAASNLAEAVRFIESVLRKYSFREAVTAAHESKPAIAVSKGEL